MTAEITSIDLFRRMRRERPGAHRERVERRRPSIEVPAPPRNDPRVPQPEDHPPPAA